MNNNTEQKEIIGYKTPCSLWSGQVPKGTLYIKNVVDNYGWEDNLDDAYNIPREIVETWEPVYAIRLPKIAGKVGEVLNVYLKWGCTSIKKETVLELNSIGCFELAFHIDGSVVQVKEHEFKQIIKFIEYNK